MTRLVVAFAIVASAVAFVDTEHDYANNYVAASFVQLNDNGAWSWFMDPRVIVDEGKLIADTEEIAYAGRRLYPTEDDYTGLGALDPNHPDVVYISTDADPATGTPLISAADRTRHYELFRGERGSNGKWTWTPFTRNSSYDNLRPVIPQWRDPRTAIVWMRGKYVHNQGEWYSALVAAIVPSQ